MTLVSYRIVPAPLFCLATCVFAAVTASADANSSRERQIGVGERPPQFVLLAFDGSKSLSMWNETRSFARSSQDVSFTYFISGVYFLGPATRNLYRGPGRGSGRSDIGFGDGPEDIRLRTQQVMSAIAEGHEMASHANGHFDGRSWSRFDWGSEFDQFRSLLEGVFVNNSIPRNDEPIWQRVIQNAFNGFRAPLLGVSSGLWETMQEQRYRYDTSMVSSSNYWPQRTRSGFWNFPLARLKVAETCKNTLSMDYNFYVAQSGAKEDPARSAVYEEQMYKSYMSYFARNYVGNRGPVHIGHHFSKWNAGAYWRAMKRFAQSVCALPEVRCATYTQLTDFMEAQDPAIVARWQRGDFNRAPNLPPGVTPPADTCSATIRMSTDESDDQLEIDVEGPDAERLLSSGHLLSLEIVGENGSLPLNFVANGKARLNFKALSPERSKFILSAVLRAPNGLEVQRSTRVLSVQRENGRSVYAVGKVDLDEAARLQADPVEAHVDEE